MAHPEIQISFDRELHLFVAASRREGGSTVPIDGTSTLGHVVESLGVPLTEVGALTVDGRAVDASYIPAGGETVEVRAMPRPQPIEGPKRFLLDIHLGTLARRLRLLGVDAAYENPDVGDAALAARSAAERRIMLSRDRGLLRRRELFAGAYIYSHRTEDQLYDVLSRFEPELAPWTRCTACNGLLRDVEKDAMRESLPAGTARTYDVFAQCTECGQAYWRGAHHERLQAIVDECLRRRGARGSRSSS